MLSFCEELILQILKNANAETVMDFRSTCKEFARIASDSKLWCELICSSTSYNSRTFCYSRKQINNCFTNNGNINVLSVEKYRYTHNKHVHDFTLDELYNILLEIQNKGSIIGTTVSCHIECAIDSSIIINLLCSSPMGYYKVMTSMKCWAETCHNIFKCGSKCNKATMPFLPFCKSCKQSKSIGKLLYKNIYKNNYFEYYSLGKIGQVNCYVQLKTKYLLISKHDQFVILGKYVNDVLINLTEDEKEVAIAKNFLVDHCEDCIIPCKLTSQELNNDLRLLYGSQYYSGMYFYPSKPILMDML